MFFPMYLRCANFTVITDVGVLIFSGQAIEVTEYENVQLIFPVFL